MEIKKENSPSKVVVIPRPPRSTDPGMDSAGFPGGAGPAQAGVQPGPQNPPIVPVDPGCGPLNNYVEGPAGGLAGVPSGQK